MGSKDIIKIALPKVSKATPKTKSGRLLEGEVVTFEVGKGEGKKRFSIRKKLLSEKVPVFDKMFNGNFKEASEAFANLPDDNPNDFNTFVEWLYSGTLIDLSRNGDQEMASFFFASKHLIEETADRYLTQYIECMKKSDWVHTPSGMGEVYTKSNPGSKMQLFIAKEAASTWLNYVDNDDDPEWSSAEFKKVFMSEPDFMYEVMHLIRGENGKRFGDPRKASKCDYHQHAKNMVCPYRSA